MVEAGLRGEVKPGGKSASFGSLFEKLMANKGHKDLTYAARAAAQAEADALNKLARDKAAAAASPTPAPSAP